MTERRPATLSNLILDEATTWFVEFHEGAQDERTREAFHDWLRTSPEHVRAYLQVAAHWEDDAPQPRGAGESAAVESIDELLDMARMDENVVPLMSRPEDPRAGLEQGVSSVTRNRIAPKRRTAVWRRYALAASLLIAVVAVSVPSYLWRNVYSTGIGEQRSLKLDDGSTVEINARSRIKVRYSERERHIDLLEGQALFHVARNEARPFIVRSGRTQIQAVGTRFDVYRKRSGTVVTVVEGRVSILANPESLQPETPASAPGSAGTIPDSPEHASASTARERKRDSGVRGSDASHGGILLAAGEQLTVSPTAPAQPQIADVGAATAWTQRRLIFVRAPLSEVVEEFNRYNSIPLVITDPSIAETEISGSFSSSDRSTLLRFLREVGSYKIRETGSVTEISRQ